MTEIENGVEQVEEQIQEPPFSIVEANREYKTLTVCFRGDFAEVVGNMLRMAAANPAYYHVQGLAWALGTSMLRCAGWILRGLPLERLQHNDRWIPENVVFEDGSERILREID